MKAKILGYALPALILATFHLAEAQQPKKVPRIGYLQAPPPSAVAACTEAFRQGLRELGYASLSTDMRRESPNVSQHWRRS